MDILKTINELGKGTWLKYGLIETIVNMLMFLLIAYFLRRLCTRYIQKHVKVNAKFVNRIVKITLYTIAICRI